MKNLKPFEAEPPTEKRSIPMILIETHHVIILRVKNPIRVWSKKKYFCHKMKKFLIQLIFYNPFLS